MIYQLIRQEWLVQRKVHHIELYSLIFFTFFAIITSLSNNPHDLEHIGPIFCLSYIPLALFGITPLLLKPDIDDGTLELLLASVQGYEIIISKLLVTALNNIIGFCSSLPFIMLFFHLTWLKLLLIGIVAMILILLSSALALLIAAIQAYFQGNTNFLVLLIMPLIIPSIVISGVLMQDITRLYLLNMLVGIDLLLIPVIIYLSTYLLQNIYSY
jgi:heme exporter protein B